MISTTVLNKLEYYKVLQYISKYSVTENGKNLILALLPLENNLLIEKTGKLVSQAKEILIRNTHPPIEYISDLEDTLSKCTIEGAIIDSKKIVEIARLAEISRNLFSFLKNNTETTHNLFNAASDLFVDKVFEHHIRKVVNENGEIYDNASPKLKEIRREIKNRNDELIKLVNRLVKSLTDKDIIREDYLTLRDGRVVIPVKVEHKRHLRGFIHSESSTGQTVYIEPEETLELNNEIISLSFAEKREIERLLRELTKKIGAMSDRLKTALSTISYIDSIFSRAHYSIEIIGGFPEINNSKPFTLIDARHPILLKKNGRSKTVPLNLEISKKKIILITGPNAGGKTVVLKTVGLLTLMMKAGIHIPVSPDSNFHSFKDVLIDIGDQQSIEDDLSTFSSHLSNIKHILQNADSNSLILIDEIGTGTDPSEGAALSTAVLLTLREKEATVFATTHHGSLKIFANELDGFENAAMEFDSENLKPAYIFKQGLPGSSYAFEVAKRIGFDDRFLMLATENLDSDKHKIESFLVEVESKSRQLKEKIKKIELENSRLAGLSNLYKQNLEKLNKDKKEILKKTKQEAEEYIRGINRKVEHVIKELRETKADNNAIKISHNIIEEIKEKNKNLFTDDIDLNKEKADFVLGDFVKISKTETSGEIIEIDKEKNKAVLRVGTVKIQADFKELIHAVRNNKKENITSSYDYNFTVPKIRLDIRGEKPEEAEFEVVKFVDNAYSSGVDRIEILHGKGTGSLKKTVKEILKKHDKIKTFYFAPLEMGGEGITIAELE